MLNKLKDNQINQACPNTRQSNVFHEQAEISLMNMLIFLKSAWRLACSMALFGLLVASVYLLATPVRYDATAIVGMAKMSTGNNVLGGNVEEVGALVARMSSPYAMTDAIMSSCGMESKGNGAYLLANSLKFVTPKGVDSIVEIKVSGANPGLAKGCADGIYQSIKQFQTKKYASLTGANKLQEEKRLATLKERISLDKKLLAKAGSENGYLAPVYFSVLLNIRALEDELIRIEEVLNANRLIETDLLVPIKVSDKPSYPKKTVIIVGGLLAGLFLGLLVALIRCVIVDRKGEQDIYSRS